MRRYSVKGVIGCQFQERGQNISNSCFFFSFFLNLNSG